jgi:dienelactone hydrolase
MADSYLAKPSGSCCLTGHLHTGTPLGTFQRIANVNTYVTYPPPSKANGHIVLYYADVFGMFTNGLLVMDGFADAGYLTVGLDYFSGDSVQQHRANNAWTDSSQTFEEWLAKYTAFAEQHVPPWIDAIKAQFGKPTTKYACVGYCFGAPYVCESLAPSSGNGKPVCTAGAFAHPAFLKESHFRNVAAPLFLSCAETDHTFDTADRNRAIDILKADRKDYQLQLFAKVKHGFALRCNLDDPYERMVKEKSLSSIAGWFDFWLGVSGEKEGREGRTANL